jgi:hypothetical protein
VSTGLADGGTALLSPYNALLVHAEFELELAGQGDLDGLDALAARWEELLAELPAAPPAEAAPVLSRARLVHERTRIELLRLRESLLGEIATATRAKRTAASYGGELPPRSRLDRRA